MLQNNASSALPLQGNSSGTILAEIQAKKIATICRKSLGSIFYFLVRLCCRHNSSETAVSKLSFTKSLNVKKYLQKRSLSW